MSSSIGPWSRLPSSWGSLGFLLAMLAKTKIEKQNKKKKEKKRRKEKNEVILQKRGWDGH